MSLSHAYSNNSSQSDDVLQNLSAQISQLKNRASTDPFDQLELELHQAFAEAERQCMQGVLEAYDWDFPYFHSGGQQYTQSSRSKKRYMTLAGEVSIERSLYRTERNGRTYSPLEQNSGLIEGFWSPQAAKQAILLVSHLTPAEAETIFQELGLMMPSKSSLDRLPKKLSHHWENQRIEMDSVLLKDIDIPKEAIACAISLDGVLIPTRYARTLPGDSRWSEASCGTASFFNSEGELLATRYMARMPERKKKALKQQLSAQIAHIKAQRPDLSILKIADGAKDNWTFLDDEIKSGESVLDFYHAAEHLFAAMENIYQKEPKKLYANYQKYRHILRHDLSGVVKVINHLKYQVRKHPSLKKLKKELTYFKNNRHRCHYAKLKSENKPIGSGIVEAACKSIVQMRLKRSGQHWDEPGGQAILTFRSIVKSKQLDTAWNEVKKVYLDPIEAPKNVVKLRKK